MSGVVKGLEGFTSHRIAVGDAEIFVRTYGEGPPLSCGTATHKLMVAGSVM
jgi:hypothetical protein